MRPENLIFNNVYDETKQALRTTATLNVGDIQIGAVEIKDAVSNNRASVNTSGELLVRLNEYFTNDLDDYSEINVIYIGKEKKDGTWFIMKLDMTLGTVIRGASVINNATYINYVNAWNNRTTLTYSYLKDVI